MKKFAMILLCLCLALFAGMAMTEEVKEEDRVTVTVFDAFDVTCIVPEDYDMKIENLNDLVIMIDLTPKDPEKPDVNMTVAHSEEYSDMTLNEDLTEEQMNIIRNMFIEDGADPKITTGVTAHGTRYVAIHEASDYDEYLVIATIWKGYVMEVDVFPGQGHTSLTDEQIQTAVDFLSSFFIIDHEQ